MNCSLVLWLELLSYSEELLELSDRVFSGELLSGRAASGDLLSLCVELNEL